MSKSDVPYVSTIGIHLKTGALMYGEYHVKNTFQETN